MAIYDQDVSYQKYGTLEQEKNLPVPMSEHYRYSRIMCDRKRLILHVFAYDVFSFITGSGIFLLYYFAHGAMNQKG